MNSGTTDQDYLKTRTVLYIEDDEDAREQFIHFLSRIVGVLISAKDGMEGLEAFKENHPHIIITDILMPNMDGLEMVRLIRAIDKHVPIIVMTAFEKIDYLKTSINMGVTKYVVKPVNGFELKETLLDCVQRLMAEETLFSELNTDPLTGLANRRTLSKRFMSEKGRAERHGTIFSVIIGDIDHFKNVNDTYGHLAGDLILKGVAGTITHLIRVEDICVRWGGEEFLLILPDTDLNSAEAVAEKLRSEISRLAFTWEEHTIKITISMGVAKFSSGMSMDECIKLADDAPYCAKTRGRNRVEVSEGANADNV